MSVKNFIPEIWNAEILLAFRQNAVAAALTNRDYEGDAKVGNAVHVFTGVPVEIKDYATGLVPKEGGGTVPRTTIPDAVATTQVAITIDQEKSFDFLVDDIDRRQAAGGLEAFAVSAAQGLVDDADKWILAEIEDAGTPLTAKAVTAGDVAFNVIRDLRKALTKALVPSGERALVVNAELEAILVGADSKLTATDVSGSSDGLRNASLGRLLGFDVYVSENLPTTAKPSAIALHKSAFAFVDAITESEALRAQDSFSDRLRGLHVYGGGVVRPEGIVTFTAS